MISCHAAAAADVVPDAVIARDAKLRVDDRLGGDAAEADDELRAAQRDLPPEPLGARLLLHAEGVAVPGRAALDDVRDIDHAAVQVDHPEHVVQELPRGADEGLALQILLLAGALADEHELGVFPADAEDQIVPRAAERAAPAVRAIAFQSLPGIHGHPSSAARKVALASSPAAYYNSGEILRRDCHSARGEGSERFFAAGSAGNAARQYAPRPDSL